MGRRRRSLVAVACCVFVAAGCSDEAPTAAPTTTATPPTTSAPTTATPGAALWTPATRSEELLAELDHDHRVTPQRAVDAFDLTIAPMPGATESKLPRGDGVGTATAMRMIRAVEQQLRPDQRAVLAALDDTEAKSAAPIAPNSSVAPHRSAPPGRGSTPAPPAAQGFVARPADRHGETPLQWYEVQVAIASTWLLDSYKGLLVHHFAVGLMKPTSGGTRIIGESVNDPDEPVCMVRVPAALWQSLPTVDDAIWLLVRAAWDCELDTLAPGIGYPAWLVDGSSVFVANDVTRGEFVPPAKWTPTGWWTDAKNPLAARMEDAWALFETAYNILPDAHAALFAMFVSGPNHATMDYLKAGGIDALDFRSVWSSFAYRPGASLPAIWTMPWPGPAPSGGPHDNAIPTTSVGLGTSTISGFAGLSQQTMRSTILGDVDIVAATPIVGMFTTQTLEGVVRVPAEQTALFCLRPEGCVCPDNLGDPYLKMSRTMIVSFSAEQDTPTMLVVGRKFDKSKCDPPRRRHAQANGDPHLVSFDGLHFDVNALGEFVAVRDSRGGADRFEVQTRNALVGQGGVGTSAVAVGCGAHRATFGGHLALGESPDLSWRVDGAPATADVSLDHLTVRHDPASDKHWTLHCAKTTVDLRWNRGWFADVTADDERVVHLDGLLGSPDGDFRNDLLDATGRFVDPVDSAGIDTRVVPRWAVRAETSLFDYGPGESTDTFRKPPASPLVVDPASSARCREALGDAAMPSEIASCAYDLTATNDDTFIGAYRTVLATRVGAPPETPATPNAPSPSTTSAGQAAIGQLTLAGNLAAYTDSNTPDVVTEVSDRITLAKGGVLVASVDACAPADSMRLRISSGSDPRAAPLDLGLCDTATKQTVAAWVPSAGTYAVQLTNDTQVARQVRVALVSDTTPTVVAAAEAQTTGFSGTLHGLGDTVVLLTDQPLHFQVEGAACTQAMYGGKLGDPMPIGLDTCAPKPDLSPGASADVVIPIVIYNPSSGDTPLRVSIIK